MPWLNHSIASKQVKHGVVHFKSHHEFSKSMKWEKGGGGEEVSFSLSVISKRLHYYSEVGV